MAQQRIIANLIGVDEEIRRLQNNARQAANAVRDINSNLQFDPRNINLITQRFTALRNELRVNEDNLIRYNQSLTTLRNEQTRLSNIGPLSPQQMRDMDAITREIIRYERAISDTTRRINYLRAASDQNVESQRIASIRAEQLRERTERLGKAFDVAQKAARTLSVVALAAFTAVSKAVTSSIELGTELYNLSIRYNTNAQDIQIWNRALQLATGQTDLFTTAVNTMVKGLSQISAGRGVAYRKSLQNIGLAYKDLEGLTTSERFRSIVEALGETADANTRLEAAQQLLGESGQSIAEMFDREGFSLDAYLEKASHFGTLTQENAQALTEMGFEFEYAKSQMSLASAQLTVALAPALQIVANAITNLSKFVNNLSKAFGGTNEGGAKMLLWLGSSIILLPKMITLLKGAVIAAQNLSVATNKWTLILNAAALAIMVIIQLVAVFSNSAKKALDDVDRLTGAAESLSGVGENFGANVESVSQTSNYREIQVGVEMHASGDTEISDEAAVRVGQITVDEIQKALGDLVK